MARHPGETDDHIADPSIGSVSIDEVAIGAAAVLAVKSLSGAKSRLAPTSTPAHRALVVAMLLDTLDAIHAAGIDRIVVVSPDETVRAAAHRAGVVATDEQMRPEIRTRAGLTGLNAALAQGSDLVRRQWPDVTRVLLIQADLPAVTGRSIREALITSAPCRQAMVADRSGVGTALLIRDPDCTDPPLFGPNSAAAHRNAGVVELDPDHLRWADLRTDVDTLDDLRAATSLGLGPRTAAALATRS